MAGSSTPATTYAVVYISRTTGEIEFVVARDVSFDVADQLAGSMQPRAREGCYFTARNDKELT